MLPVLGSVDRQPGWGRPEEHIVRVSVRVGECDVRVGECDVRVGECDVRVGECGVRVGVV